MWGCRKVALLKNLPLPSGLGALWQVGAIMGNEETVYSLSIYLNDVRPPYAQFFFIPPGMEGGPFFLGSLLFPGSQHCLWLTCTQ